MVLRTDRIRYVFPNNMAHWLYIAKHDSNDNSPWSFVIQNSKWWLPIHANYLCSYEETHDFSRVIFLNKICTYTTGAKFMCNAYRKCTFSTWILWIGPESEWVLGVTFTALKTIFVNIKHLSSVQQTRGYLGQSWTTNRTTEFVSYNAGHQVSAYYPIQISIGFSRPINILTTVKLSPHPFLFLTILCRMSNKTKAHTENSRMTIFWMLVFYIPGRSGAPMNH